MIISDFSAALSCFTKLLAGVRKKRHGKSTFFIVNPQMIVNHLRDSKGNQISFIIEDHCLSRCGFLTLYPFKPMINVGFIDSFITTTVR